MRPAMMLLMPVLEIESRGMAKTKQGDDRANRPNDEVRYLAIMTRDERARLKAFCARIGEDMERLGARWIVERLTVEERKLSR